MPVAAIIGRLVTFWSIIIYVELSLKFIFQELAVRVFHVKKNTDKTIFCYCQVQVKKRGVSLITCPHDLFLSTLSRMTISSSENV